MNVKPLVVVLAWMGFMAGGALHIQGGHAAEKEYKPTAKTTKLVKTGLAGMEGSEVTMIRRTFAPGWVGAKHFHSGHVFLYVLEGTIVVKLKGKTPVTVRPGEVLHERPNEVMQAKNGSATDALTVILFQVGPKGKPMMIQTK